MALLIIETGSAAGTDLLLQFAAEHGFTVKTEPHRVLTDADMVTGIGRKATEAELTEYLLKGDDGEEIDIETVFAKFK